MTRLHAALKWDAEDCVVAVLQSLFTLVLLLVGDRTYFQSTCDSFNNVAGGMSMFMCVSWCLRQRVIEKYYVNEPETCCCGPCNPLCEFFHVNCNYPCSFFQMYVSIKEFEAERRKMRAAGLPSSVTNPVVPSAPPATPQRVQPSAPPQTPVAYPRDAAPAYLQHQLPVTYTPAQAIVVDASTGVQVAMPVATPIGAAEYYPTTGYN
jgi:hypothetical protein